MASPIERMIDAACMKCAKCGHPVASGFCSCWEKCRCGWSFEAGKTCRNPKHTSDKCAEALAKATADDIFEELWLTHKIQSLGLKRKLRELIEQHVKETLIIVYDAIDDTRPLKRK